MSETVVETNISESFVFDLAKYEQVSKAARLREVKLVSSSYHVKPQAFAVSEDDDKVKKKFMGKVVQFHLDADAGIAWGRLEWLAEVKISRQTVIKLVAEYLLVYSEVDGCDPEHTSYYFKKVGRFATYPYFRALFSHHIGETGIAMAPLPTLSERVD